MNVFSVDVEEWFHMCGVGSGLAPDRWHALPSRVVTTTARLLDELDAAQVTATFFVLGWVADRYPELVGRIQAAGHAIASHGYGHVRVPELGPAAFSADLSASVRALQRAGAGPITAFRAPEWSLNTRTPWAFDELVAQGFTVDASMAPVRIVGNTSYPRQPHRRMTTHGTIVEVPPFVVDRLGQVVPLGWGWALRTWQPRRVLRAIEQSNRLGQPAVLTVHPWEIDDNPPRVRLPLRLHFAHYFRLSGFVDRLRIVLRTAPFSTLEHVALAPSPS
jgi:polysaccharide deacetylase family protein (PEP-CTERM system associated)